MEKFIIKGVARQKTGSHAAHAVRHEGWVPANLYGHGEGNVNFQLRANDLQRLVHEGHHMMTLDIDGKQESGLLRELQFDTYGENIVHVDFARVSMDEVVEINIPVVIEGTARGVAQGGVLDVLHHEVELRGKAGLIPETIVIAVDDLGLEEAIRAHQLKLPEGVEALLDPEEAIVIVHEVREEEEATPAEAEAEPEVVGKKPADEE